MGILSRALVSSAAAALAGPSASTFSRTIVASSRSCDLREFLDTQNRSGEQPTYGRAWKAAELRSKSWEDLHKLWYVCLKERNMLVTEMAQAKAASQRMPQPQRYKMVKLTMNRIKQVMGQRAAATEELPVKIAMKRFIDNL